MKIKLILKGMLLYATAFAVLFLIMGIDSVLDKGYFIPFFTVCTVLCYTSYRLISEEELETLTFYKYFGKLEE